MKFADVTGQRALKDHLTTAVASGRVSHAQLFAGAAGTGTLPLALAYVQYLNCPDRLTGDSCGVCPSCRQIAALAHPDLHLVFPVNKQGKKSGEVVTSDEFMPQFREAVISEQGYLSPQKWFERLDLGKTLKGVIAAREADGILKKLSLKSFSAPWKTVLIWLPETMNEETANKLLKILEEPWPSTLFLLVSERPEQLLPTILSRTQRIDVPPIDTESLKAIEPNQTLVELAAGDRIRLQELQSNRQSEHFERFAALMRLSYNDRHLELIDWAEQAAALPREGQKAMLTDMTRLLRAAYLHHAGLRKAAALWGEEKVFVARFAPFVGNGNIEELLALIETALSRLSQNGSPVIVLTYFALAASKLIRR